MARPKNADPEETRQRILNAAIEELDEFGALDLSTRRVARRAGVAVSTVHGHFVDRQGLLDAVINRVYERLASAAVGLSADIRGATSLRQIIGRAVRGGFRFGRGHQNEIRALLLQTMAEGSLDATRRRNTQLPFLVTCVAVFGPALGLPDAAVRLRVQSLLFTIGRFCVSSDDELRIFVGEEDIDVCVRAVEDHLVEMAISQLAPEARARRASGMQKSA